MIKLSKIILVEDDPIDAELTIAELKSIPLSNEIVWLETGQELLEYIEKNGTKEIAVVVLDLNMPVVSGIEALEIIREKKYSYFPIVILSSSRLHPDVNKCYKLGVNSFISKPVKTAEFQQAVKTLGIYWGIFNKVPEKI